MQTVRRITWDPHPDSPRFAVAGANEIRLLQWHPDKQAVQTLAVTADLPNIRTLAWSPHQNAHVTDLVAVGLATGRTLLLRMNESNQIPLQQSSTPAVTSVALNVRHARPVTSLAFAPGNLLAVGLEKARDHGLLIYDIESSARQFERSTSYNGHSFASPASTSRPGFSRMQSSASNSQTPEVRPLMQFGSSESVSATAFLCSGTPSPSLVAGMGASKWIRVFDLRTKNTSASSSTASLIYSTRSVLGISADPFDGHRFLSYGDDALIRLWDTRKSTDPLIMFSEADAGDNGRPEKRPNQLLSVLFSPTSRGIIASCEATTAPCRIWNLTTGEKTDPHNGDPTNMSHWPLLLSQRRGKAFIRAPNSVAFANSSNNTSLTIAAVSKEGQIEMVSLPNPSRTSLSVHNDVAAISDPSSSPRIIPRATAVHTFTDADLQPPASPIHNTSALQTPTFRAPRARTNSARSFNSRRDDETTADEHFDSHRRPSSHPIGSTLDYDISTIIRDRIAQGYGTHLGHNQSITSDNLSKFWCWISHAEYVASSAGKIFTDKYDFAFIGVEGVLKGLEPIIPVDKERERRGSGRGKERASSPNRLEGSWGRSTDKEEKEYNAVVDKINKILDTSAYITASTKMQGRRKLALSVCGWDFMTGDVEALVNRLETEGNITRAAAYAMFTGNTSQAIAALRNSEDDRLKLLAPTLASYLAQQRATTHSPADASMFKEICGNLSSELEDAYLRAIFAFLASSSWQDVLEEEAMALVDRLSVALRFLNDDELNRYITKLSDHAVSSGDLEGLVLTGLTTKGFTLIQNYLDRSGDVQTAALAASMVHPARLPDARAERWIANYRKLLNQWTMYEARANFDIARGNRMRQTQALLKTAGKDDSLVTVSHVARQFVRCNYCNLTISSTTSVLNRTKRRGKATTCPSCGKGFPRCSICLDTMAIPEVDAQIQAPAWSWCSMCRHGGHAAHLQEWFDSGRSQCPVPSCYCNCDGD